MPTMMLICSLTSRRMTRSRMPPRSTSVTCMRHPHDTRTGEGTGRANPPLPRSFYTTEEQVYELFSKCGEIKRLVMGLDRIKKTPCGFCFVEYYTHQDALDCMKYIGGTKLDERVIRTDPDPGFIEGRQYGRGRSGGQVRDEYREDFDEGRGGVGRAVQQQRVRDRERQDNDDDYGRLR